MNIIIVMHTMDGKKLDLNLLVVLVALLDQRSVTAAARKLGLSQPAVSHALSRLRKNLNDPLFVSVSGRFEPTARALSLGRDVEPLLSAVEANLRASQQFDPGTTTRTFRIGMSDDVQAVLLPRIMGRTMKEAPSARVVAISTDYRRVYEMMKQQEVTTAVGYLEELAAPTKVQKLKRVGYKVVSSTGFPSGPFEIEQYCAAPHALVTFAGDLTGYIDEKLSKLGTSRSICLSMSSFAALPYVLSSSNLIATVPEYFATELERVGGLNVRDLPFKSPMFNISMAWRPEADRDPAELWIRKVLRSEFGQLSAN